MVEGKYAQCNLTNKKVIPEIRFKGFTEPWEQRKLNELARYTPSPLTVKDINENGYYDLYDANEVIGKTDKSAFFTEYISIIKDGAGVGRVRKLSKNTSILGTMGAIIPQNSNYDFLFYTLEKTDFSKHTSGGTIPHIYFKQYGENIYSIPTLAEQIQIGTFFANLDNLITLHQRKYEKLHNIKKSMLEKMFPKNGSNVPEIRFKGFTEAWEQRKLDSLFEPLTERNNDLLPYNKTLSVATMTYKEVGNGAADSSLANYKRLRLGDIAFEGHTSKEFRYGRFVLNDAGDGIMSPRFSALRPISELPVQFWKYYIHYEPIMKRLLVNCTKAGTMMNELVVPEFLRETLLVPSTDEQVQIGQFLTTIDRLITLHQRELEKLQNIKKSMLEKMFV